jgi:hypothetical protein
VDSYDSGGVVSVLPFVRADGSAPGWADHPCRPRPLSLVERQLAADFQLGGPVAPLVAHCGGRARALWVLEQCRESEALS